MCIIVAKPSGVDFPSSDVIRDCFNANPDGAGFMYADGKKVRIRKGFMSVDALMDALTEELGNADLTDTPVVLHFRIATHGKVGTACCHPFPVSDEPAALRAGTYESSYGVAHNGVINWTTTNNNWSDTMDFTARVIYPLMMMDTDFINDDYALDVIEATCCSKFAILSRFGDHVTIGDFIEDGGIYYSNTSYMFSSRIYKPESIWDYYDNGLYDWGEDDENTEPFGEDVASLIDRLPWDACSCCYYAEECALEAPFCEDELTANRIGAYFLDGCTHEYTDSLY